MGCVPLESERCTMLAEPADIKNDRTIWIGAVFPLTGPQAEGGIPSRNAVELGRRDFAQITHGIPSLRGGESPRPLGVISCDDATSVELSASHLIALGVPAVIGFGSSKEVIDLSTSMFLPHGVLVVPSINASALITAVPHPKEGPRLIYRTSLSSAQTAVPVGLVVSDLIEPALRSKGMSERLRVAFVRPRSPSGLAFADALVRDLRFNGKSVAANGDDFRAIALAGSEAGDGGAIEENAIAEVLAQRPHAVVFLGEGELVDTFFRPLESRWPAGIKRPAYVSASSILGDAFFTFIGTDAGLRRRFFGVAAPAATPANAKFTMHYNETFEPKMTVNDSPAGPYDALYLVAYAAFISGERAPSDGDLAAGDLSGASLSRSIARLLPPGLAVDVGPAQIFQAVGALREGGTINLAGAGNPLDFDRTTGESPADYVIECVGVDARGHASGSVESGVGFLASAKSLHGTLHCP